MRPRLSLLTAGMVVLAALSVVTPATAEPTSLAATTARPTATAKLGDLRVAITGLPARVAASVKVTGPSFPRGIVVTANRTLTNLKPGSYTVTARSLPTAKGRLVPSPATRKVVVVKGKSVTAAIAYTFVGQPITLTLRVNGKVGGVALPNKPALVSLTLTNQSRTRTLGGFTVVVPKGSGAIKTKTIVARGKWGLIIKPCGRTPNCSSLIVAAPVVSRAIPLSKSVILPRGALTVNLTFTTPTVRNRYPLTLTNIGSGFFTVSGSPAVLQVFPGETVIAQPHVSVPLAPVTVGTNSTATASLPNGAYGPVSLFTEPAPCIGGAAPPCDTVTLDGTFVPPVAPKTAKQPHALPGNLYSFAHPASITFTCSAAKCPRPGSGTVVKLRAGADVTCAVTTNSIVSCWGEARYGQLGAGLASATSNPQATPVTIPHLGLAVDVAVGAQHACAITGDTSVACWGTNLSGQLGNATGVGTSTAFDAQYVPGLTGVTSIAAGDQFTCAVIGGDQASGGTVSCWGAGTSGQLGNGSTNSSSAPVTVSNISNAVSVSAGAGHACARLVDLTVACWGRNDFGQLGNANAATTNSSVPVVVDGITSAGGVSAGGTHSCAVIIGSPSVVQCWGSNSAGELGNGTTSVGPTSTPVTAAIPSTVDAIEVSAGGNGSSDHTCALLNDTSPWCWGNNLLGQTGEAFATVTLTPTAVPLTSAQTTTGQQHSCALLTDSSVWCWGDGASGQIGVVSTDTSVNHTPRQVTGIDANGDPLNDTIAFPLNVSIKVGGVYRPFTTAPPCNAFGGGAPTGQIVLSAAQILGFCVDVFATSRDASGTLSRTVLFVEDPKFTAISR